MAGGAFPYASPPPRRWLLPALITGYVNFLLRVRPEALRRPDERNCGVRLQLEARNEAATLPGNQEQD